MRKQEVIFAPVFKRSSRNNHCITDSELGQIQPVRLGKTGGIAGFIRGFREKGTEDGPNTKFGNGLVVSSSPAVRKLTVNFFQNGAIEHRIKRPRRHFRIPSARAGRAHLRKRIDGKYKILFLCGLLPVVLLSGGKAPRLNNPALSAAAQKALSQLLRQDDPAAANEYFALRRQPTDGASIDLFDRYRRARLHADRMPRFSTLADRFLPPSNAPQSEAVSTALGAAQWEPLGPGNIGGRTRALLVDPNNPQILYAAGVSGGIWKTVDGGQFWKPLADFLPNIAVGSMAMDPKNSQILYAGTGEGHFREIVRGTGLPLRGAGVFKSQDGGENWRRLDRTANSDFHWVNRLEVSPRDSRRLYAATRSGVWRSLDGGESWARVLDPQVLGGCFDLALRSDVETDHMLASCGTFAQATVYFNSAAEGNGAWRSALSEFGMGLTSLALAPSRQERVYALSASHLGGPGGRFNGGLHAVFRSDSGGAPGTWTPLVRNSDPNKLNTLLLTNPLIANLATCAEGGRDAYSNLGWYTNMLAVDPSDPDVVWAGGVDLFRSDDGGRNWGLVTYWWNSPPSAHADQHVIVFHPEYDGDSQQTLFLGGDGGVWRTDNARAAAAVGPRAACDSSNSAVAWRSLNNNYGVTQFYHGTPLPDGRGYLGGTQDNGTLLGGDRSGIDGWQNILGGDGGYVAVDPKSPNVIYAEAQFLNFHKSTDGGQSFVPSVNGIGDGSRDVLFITPFVMDPSESRRLWTGGRRLWRTGNGAESWDQASAPLGFQGRVSALAVAGNDPNRVAVGKENGEIHRSENALSANAATVWPSSRPREGFVTWLAFDPVDADILYASYGGFGGAHLWKSVDRGASWVSLDGNGATAIPDIPVHSVIVDPEDRQRIYLGTDLGVFVSTDGGQRWAVENSGFANAVTESLALSKPANGPALLFAFTHGRGAWRVPLGTGEANCVPDRWIVHVTPPDAPFLTTIFASNFSSQENQLTLVPYDEAGADLPPASLTVPAGGSLSIPSSQLFLGQPVSHFGICGPASTAVSAGYRITSIAGVTAHVSETITVDREFLAYTGEPELVFDGMAWVNLGDSPARVTAARLDEAGAEAARVTLNEALPPHAKELAVFDAEFEGVAGRVVRIESDQPGAVLLLRGTFPPHEPMVLFEVPAIAVSARR